MTRELLGRGAARVIGVDACEALVVAARGHPGFDSGRSVFHHADVADLPVSDRSVDVVVANRLPNGIGDPGRRFGEFARVLRSGGRLVALGMHPCFYAARAERGTGGGFVLEKYLGMITGAGFVITRLSEPHPTAQQSRDNPWWEAHFTRPLFLMVECRVEELR